MWCMLGVVYNFLNHARRSLHSMAVLIQNIDGGVRYETSSKRAQVQASLKEAREESDFASS
jgi:hypothetical protein